MEDITGLLQAAEARLREAEEIIAKIDMEASGEILVSCQKLIKRHRDAEDALLDKKGKLLRHLKKVIAIVHSGNDRYTVELPGGGYVAYVSFAHSVASFAVSFSTSRVYESTIARSDAYWPLVENYISVLNTALQEISSGNLSTEAEKLLGVVREISSLAENQ